MKTTNKDRNTTKSMLQVIDVKLEILLQRREYTALRDLNDALEAMIKEMKNGN